MGAVTKPPAELNDLQKELWNAAIALVDLETIDQLIFQQAIVSLSYVLEAQKLVASEGLFIVDQRNMGTGNLIPVRVEHPALKVMERHQKLFNSFADRLGWSPLARKQVRAALADREDDDSQALDPFSTPPELTA